MRSESVQRAILFLLLLFSPLSALADGMIVPSTAYPATVTIPDQRALICFSNGVERLVIETRFTGAGTNFAWVVPLPGKPLVEQATTGLFPTLQFVFRPQVVTNVPQYFPWISGLIWIGYVFLFVRPTGRITWLDIASCVLVGVCIASAQATEHLPRGVWIAMGTLALICLMFILALLRHWRADMYAIAVALLALFITLQLLGACAYITPWQVEPIPLLVQPVVWFFAGLDLVLIIALAASRQAARIVCAVLLFFLILTVAASLLPVGSRAVTAGLMSDAESVPVQAVSVLQRKVVGIFDTTTIASTDATALQDWLDENGYSVPANAGPVIADYVKDGWVFVATKIRRDETVPDTLTPHPLSFTFSTDKPVYPMRLTGLANSSLSVDLYVFGTMRAAAPHFKVVSCTQPGIGHPLLAKWTAGLPVATKLSGTLTANEMRQDVWLDQKPFGSEQPDRMYSRQAAWLLALNRGAEFFAVGLAAVCVFRFLATGRQHENKAPALVGLVIIASVMIIGLSYLSVHRVTIRWVRGGSLLEREQSIGLLMSLKDGPYADLAQARAAAQKLCQSNEYAQSWNNDLTGEPVHEEDSPGNYVLQQTNQELQLVTFDANGNAEVSDLGQLTQ